MSEKERNIAESLTRACELLPDGKKEYLNRVCRRRSSYGGEGQGAHQWKKKKPAPDGAGHEKEVSGVKIIIEADSKEIAALVSELQERRRWELFESCHISRVV